VGSSQLAVRSWQLAIGKTLIGKANCPLETADRKLNIPIFANPVQKGKIYIL
jgi:hypothetical protein